jgi:hypothetical protein
MATPSIASAGKSASTPKRRGKQTPGETENAVSENRQIAGEPEGMTDLDQACDEPSFCFCR